MLMAVLYLATIVAANLLVAQYGQSALPFTALVLIPFDLTSRDVLHDRWSKKSQKTLYAKMGLLIGTGAVITYLFNADAVRVAIASTVAFTTAAIIDTVVYELFRQYPREVKMNASNLCSSVTDSLVFPIIAFGAISPWLSLTQSIMKFGGGIAWTMVLVWYSTWKRDNSSVAQGNRSLQGEEEI